MFVNVLKDGVQHKVAVVNVFVSGTVVRLSKKRSESHFHQKKIARKFLRFHTWFGSLPTLPRYCSVFQFSVIATTQTLQIYIAGRPCLSPSQNSLRCRAFISVDVLTSGEVVLQRNNFTFDAHVQISNLQPFNLPRKIVPWGFSQICMYLK